MVVSRSRRYGAVEAPRAQNQSGQATLPTHNDLGEGKGVHPI